MNKIPSQLLQMAMALGWCLFSLGCGEAPSPGVDAKPQATSGESDAFENEARAMIAQYANTLQGALKAAMMEGGPVKAIEVCQVKAPAIAQAMNANSSLSIRRISLRARNPKAVPSKDEQRILEVFDAQLKQGQPLSEMEYTGTISGKRFFLKAIGTMGLCLNCHGKELNPDVVQALGGLYPEDRATGYAEGEVRGAFLVEQRP